MKDDSISRQDAIMSAKAIYQNDWMSSESKEKYVLEMLEELPSAQQWIPCNERLPDDYDLMLVNYIGQSPDVMDIWIGWHNMENVWYIDGEVHSKEFGNEVIAWMPLPKPYKDGDVE